MESVAAGDPKGKQPASTVQPESAAQNATTTQPAETELSGSSKDFAPAMNYFPMPVLSPMFGRRGDDDSDLEPFPNLTQVPADSGSDSDDTIHAGDDNKDVVKLDSASKGKMSELNYLAKKMFGVGDVGECDAVSLANAFAGQFNEIDRARVALCTEAAAAGVVAPAGYPVNTGAEHYDAQSFWSYSAAPSYSMGPAAGYSKGPAPGYSMGPAVGYSMGSSSSMMATPMGTSMGTYGGGGGGGYSHTAHTSTPSWPDDSSWNFKPRKTRRSRSNRHGTADESAAPVFHGWNSDFDDDDDDKFEWPQLPPPTATPDDAEDSKSEEQKSPIVAQA